MTDKVIKIGNFELKKLESFPPDSNPFEHDCFNMGTPIARNCMIMHRTHTTMDADYLCIVNTDTGERLSVVFKNEKDKKDENEGDDQLRENIKNRCNGSYAFLICRDCEDFLASSDGHIDEAVIVSGCPECCAHSQEWEDEHQKWRDAISMKQRDQEKS